MNLNLPTSRGRFGRFGGYSPLSGIGACNPMVGSKFCLDTNTGNVVDCGSKVCTDSSGGGSTSPGWSTNANPSNPVYQDIALPGFTGTFHVQTLDSFLNTVLQAKESPFIANAIARGADTVDNQANDFFAQAQMYCDINGALPDCNQQAQLVSKYQALYRQWAAGQSARTYQSGDTGTLANPYNALDKSAPTYQYVAPAQPTNVLNPPGTGNPVQGQTNVTGNQTSAITGSTDILTWLKDNWVLVTALGVGGLVLFTTMGKKG